MGALGNINELAEKLDIKVSKIRNWKKHQIFVPIKRDREDGKSLLFHLDAENIKFLVAQELLLDYSLEEIGRRFGTVFGKKNTDLINDIQKTKNENNLVEKYLKKVLEA